MNIIRQNLDKYDLEFLNEIKNILNFLKEILENNTKTREYIVQIYLKLKLYENGLLENSNNISYLNSCYFFSQKIDMKKIKCPQNFNSNDKNIFNNSVNRLKECWNELGKKFSFKNSLTNSPYTKVQLIQIQFINNTTLNLI